jgi:hypothetical protein
MVVATKIEGELEFDLDCACSCSECKAENHNKCEYGACWLTAVEADSG